MRKRQRAWPPLTRLELRIMQILWEAGPLNVQAVQERLGDGLAYTTVQTMLNVLDRKGHVARELVGRAYSYRPLQNRETARGGAVRDLLNRMFDGSADDLVMNMLEAKQINPAKLEELIKRFEISQGELE